MTTITITNTIAISALKSTDFIEWSRLFKEYETYCTNTIPEEQYRKTFDRLLNPERHVYALVVRESESEEGGKLLGIAHYIMHEMTGSEHMVMLLSGMHLLLHIVCFTEYFQQTIFLLNSCLILSSAYKLYLRCYLIISETAEKEIFGLTSSILLNHLIVQTSLSIPPLDVAVTPAPSSWQ